MKKQRIIDKHASALGTVFRRPRVSHQKKYIHPISNLIALLLLAPSRVLAGEQPAPPVETAKAVLADLTFSNFFSRGWDEPWTRRARGDGTPDLSLLRVQTNFLTDVFRLDYAAQRNFASNSVRGTDALTGTLEYAINRRFELAVVGYYNWIDNRASRDLNGGTEGAFVRMAWVDTATSSLSTNLRVTSPNHDIGGKDTTVSLAVTGWHDLAPLGLKGVGLYAHLQEETLAGPIATDDRRNDLTYDITLAKTWTGPKAFLGNASTFVEAYGVTNLDGNNRGHTVVTLTPAFRATIAKRHVFMVGVDFPLTEPNPFERIYRFTYIYCF